MNISGNSSDSTFTVGLSTDKIQDLGGTVEIDLSDNKINLIAPEVLVNGVPIDIGGGGVDNPLTSNLSIGAFDITGLSNGQTLQGINTDVIALEEKTVNITLASFPVSTTMVGILTVDNLKTNDIKDILETSTIALNVGAVDITSTNLNFNGNSVLYNNFPSSITAGSFIKTGGTSNQYLMANGTSLQYSANSGNSNFYLYKSHTNTPAPPPANGFVYYNNSNQSLATIIYISHLTDDVIDIEVFFNNLNQINDVYLQDKNNSINFIKYNITGTPTITINSHITIPVSVISSGGSGSSSFGVNHDILLSFFTNNIEVDTRISSVESKTQNQTAILNSTTLTGILDVPTLETSLIRDIVSGTAEIFLTPGLIEVVSNALLYNNNQLLYSPYPLQIEATSFRKTGGLTTQFLKANGDSDSNTYATTSITNALTAKTANIASVSVGVDTNFSGTLTSSGFIKISGLSTEFLKADGSSDIRSYNSIQYLMTTAPATISNSNAETVIIGTGLTSNGMSMTFTDGLNYSRNIYIAGTIKYLANAVLTIRYRVVGGTIKVGWVITLPNTAVGPTMIPFIMNINYSIFTPNLYVSSCNLNIAGAVATTSFTFNGSQACALLNLNRTISAQWGAASAFNQLTITELMVRNNYVG